MGTAFVVDSDDADGYCHLPHGLPEAQRQVVALRFIAGLSVAETAQALKKTENNVKVLQHKAIAKLRLMVERD